MLDRYGRQVFTEYYFPWLEEVAGAEDAPSSFDDAPSYRCRVLSFRNASQETQSKAPNLAPQEAGAGGEA